MNGIIYINKPKNSTSRDVVNVVSKKLGTKKVGHTGTLDPMATGVLIVCVNKATKIVEDITSYDKEYEAELTLGIKTDTGDITGKVKETKDYEVTDKKIEYVLNEMKGMYLQEVPIYSAVKINGKKLYEYAREGIEVELPKREVNIKSLELVSKLKDGKFKIRTSVSKGTYIRALVEDISEKLGTVGTMSELTRTKQGTIELSDCVELDDVSESNIIDIADILPYKKVIVADELKVMISNGRKLNNEYNEDKILFIDVDGLALAIYEIDRKDNKLIKPTKVFI